MSSAILRDARKSLEIFLNMSCSLSLIIGILKIMKNYINVITLMIFILSFLGCGKNNAKVPSEVNNFGKEASYAFGMNSGLDMKDFLASYGIVIDVEQFIKGMEDSISGGKTRYTADEAEELIEASFSALMQGINAEYIKKETAFLAENSKKPGVIITSSGMQYEVIIQADGPKPLYTDTVLVNYSGKLLDGTVFDSSYDRGAPMDFPLNQVIPGWSEGLQLMNVGSKYIFYIPSELGYGQSGRQNIIPPYSTLIFEVELLDIIYQD
jgi:FKBP-type peptidyl-prolyl cis-trans isomerase FkpA